MPVNWPYIWMELFQVKLTTLFSKEFQFNMPENFIYNTTLPCLGIKAAEKQGIEKSFEYYYSIQEAFYTENLDITQLETLKRVAEKIKLDLNQFNYDIKSKECQKNLRSDFDYCEQANIKNYPSLMGVHQDKQMLLVSGYLPYAKLEKQVMAWMIKSVRE